MAEKRAVHMVQLQAPTRGFSQHGACLVSNQSVNFRTFRRVGFDVSQDGEQDGQRREALLAVDNLQQAFFRAAVQNHSPDKVGCAGFGGVKKVSQEFASLALRPGVTSLVGRHAEPFAGAENTLERALLGTYAEIHTGILYTSFVPSPCQVSSQRHMNGLQRVCGKSVTGE